VSPDAERPGHIEAASVRARGLLAFTARLRRTARCSRSRGAATCSPSSTPCPRPATSWRWSTSSTTTCCARSRWSAPPEECAAEIWRRFGDVADRVCAYFPGTQHPTGTIRALAEALQSSW